MSATKTVFITGCSEGGLGFGLAKEYHERGHRVFASARSLASMVNLQAMGIETLALDVTDFANICAVKDLVAERTGGKLDILVNNAGVPSVCPLAELQMEEAKRVFDVNTFGVMETTRIFLPLIVASCGSIILVGSYACFLPMPFHGAYNMAKAALLAYGDTLRIELAPFHVKVMTILSGTVKTNIAKVESFQLSEDSMYGLMKDWFPENQRLFNENTMPMNEWVYGVVTETLKAPAHFKAHVWMARTTSMWMTWFGTLLWRTYLDAPLSNAFGLARFNTVLQEKKKRAD